MNKKEIYLIRHGETDFNKKGIVQGKGIDSSLNEKGLRQAKNFFEKYKDVAFDKIYVSALKRTFETVQFFQNKNIPIEKNEGLDEISWGTHEGRADTESFKQFYKILHQWKTGETKVKIEKGESPFEVQLRQKRFLEYIKEKPENKLLICSHGRAMRILLCTMLNKSLSEMDTFPHHNVCLYKLNYDAGVFTIEIFNDISHVGE